MKYNTKYGAVWFAIMLPINAIIGIISTMIGIVTLLAGDTSLWYLLPIGLFCLFNIKVYFELAQNLTSEELRSMILEDAKKMYIWNESLRSELLKEMERMNRWGRPDGWNWIVSDAEKYHKLMYEVLSLMVHFPLAITDETILQREEDEN